MDILTTRFQELWEGFIDSFKGDLLTESRKQNISFPLAKLALGEAVSSWTSEYTINGRWLYNLLKSNPAKGELVKEIITKDISLTEVKDNSSKSDGLKYLAPLGVGALGYGVARWFEMETMGTLISTILPMFAAYPIATNYLSNQHAKAQDSLINAYVNQLNKYKESIWSVLLAQ